MQTEVESIVVSYETLGMSVEEIAGDRELEISSVKAALMQGSSKYRRECGKEDEAESRLNFTDSDLEAANEVIRNIAVYGEDPYLKFKAATYIRDDKKGRKEIVKQVAGQQFNILLFNEHMAKVRGVAEEAKKKFLGNGHTVNV
jgi:hypothetical protein